MERIGRYQIVRELGRGSMSIVYEGFDGRIDRHLAIKVLRSRFARDVAARQRFLREARAAGGLSHPNIVTVFDVGQAESAPYIVMELLEGGTLEDWLNRDGFDDPDVSQLLDLAAQLARGLAFAHENGVIHRDIKPANIHFDPGTNLAKMMDFGIAATEARAALNEDSPDVAGTLTHLAPELLAGESATVRSDLYSLGVVLYQLLSGHLPYDADEVPVLVEQIARHAVRPLEPIRADTPRELVDLTRRLMAAEPEARPATAALVAEEIEEIRSGIRQGILEAVRRKSAVWRWPLVTGLGVSLILMVGLADLYRSQNETMTETTFGFGDALASLIAQETAEALILDDTTALSLLVSDFAANPEIRYLHITDPEGTVQASTDPYLRGERAPPPAGQSIERPSGSGVALNRSGDGVLEFRVPIRFQARRVGAVRLGLDGRGLDAAAASLMWMLGLVFACALLALTIGLAWITRRQQRGLSRLDWGLRRLQRGQYEFRLDPERRDEFTHVYSQFNRLAVRLDEARRPGRARLRPARRNAPAVPDDVPIDETVELAPAKSDAGSGGSPNSRSANSDSADSNSETDSDTDSDSDGGSAGKVTRLRRG